MSANKNYFGAVDNVVLKVYNTNYPVFFRNEVDLLKAILKSRRADYHHVGSTAVPGMMAKPIVDIAVGLSDFPLRDHEIEKLKDHGYVYWDTNPDPSHQFFFKNLPRTHHLHFYPSDSEKLLDKIIFRDLLKSDPTLQKEYEKLKLQLAKQFEEDRESYTKGKSPFVHQVLKHRKVK